VNINDVNLLARDLMDAHGLHEWTLTFDNAKRRLGCCRFATKTISLSRPLAEINEWNVVNDTILHEIAHALAGPRAGHGPKWRTVARQVGATPVRCADAAEVATLACAWTGACPSCDFTVGRHRLAGSAKTSACPECCRRHNGGRYSEDYRLQWTRNT
jgi:predicted SprT family Zn-dependent metalloprotease